MASSGEPSKKSSSSAVARKLSILVGICGSLVLLSSTTTDSLLRDARSTILPRLLAAVTDAVADDAANDEEDGATTSVPIDEDAEAPLNLTSTYQNHAERMAERRLASPAPPSSDIVPNEYIVGINPWAYAYNFPVSGTGTCYMHGGAQPEVKGTFYARDGSSRCYRVEIGQGGNKIRQTTDGRSAAACSGTTGPSTSGYDKTVGTLRTRYSNNIYYTGGNDCYPLNPFKDYNRRGRVYLYYDTSLGPSEYRAVASEPSECNYRINIYLPSCLLDSMWTYRHSTYGGVQQATDLIGKVGGSINQVFQYSLHGFSATMTSTQAAQMLKEQVVAYVEPSYVVHSRSINNGGQGIVPGSPLRRGNVDAMDDEARRRLAIPMFNVKEPAAHWGLERLSSRGGKNGKYLYFHIGEKTHLYLFDTAINENHDEFWPFDRFGNATERHICIGSPDDYLTNVHGTHVASLAAGMNYGTARNGTIHPVQVLDATGKGTTTSVLCGVEWLINDQLQYNYANEVDPITNEGTGPRKSIASITWGTNGRSDILDMAIGNLAKVGGVPAVVAAGNDGGKLVLHIECGNFLCSVTFKSLAFLGKARWPILTRPRPSSFNSSPFPSQCLQLQSV